MEIHRQEYLRRVNAILTAAFHANCSDLASRIVNALEACITKPAPTADD